MYAVTRYLARTTVGRGVERVGGPVGFAAQAQAQTQASPGSDEPVIPTNAPGRPEPTTGEPLDPFELEFDRFNGGAMADLQAARAGPPPEPLDRPVDLETEFDRDDPDAVDVNALYDEESPNEEEDLLGREVDLDDEYDLMHDRAEEAMAGTVERQVEKGGQSVGQRGRA